MIPVGTRVELAPHLDLWMRGARYGVVEGYMRTGATKLPAIAKVRLDALPRTSSRVST